MRSTKTGATSTALTVTKSCEEVSKLTITLIFPGPAPWDEPRRKTARIKDAVELKELAQQEGITALTPCKPAPRGGYTFVGGVSIAIKDDKDAPLPMAALLAVEKAIDEHGTSLFMVATAEDVAVPNEEE